jgi:hypothetical protein
MICDDGGSTEFLVDVWITIFGLPLFLTLSRELTPEWRSKFHQRTEPSRRGLGTTSYGEKAPQLALKPIGKVDNHHRASNRNLRVPSTRTVRRSSIANYRDQQRRARQAGNHSFSWLCQQNLATTHDRSWGWRRGKGNTASTDDCEKREGSRGFSLSSLHFLVAAAKTLNASSSFRDPGTQSFSLVIVLSR